MAIPAGLLQRNDFLRSGRILYADARCADPIVALRLGNDVQNMALGHHHQTLSSVGFRSNPSGFVCRDPRRLCECWHGAILIVRKFAWRGSSLYGERSFQLQQIQQIAARSSIGRVESQPCAELDIGRVGGWCRWSSDCASSGTGHGGKRSALRVVPYGRMVRERRQGNRIWNIGWLFHRLKELFTQRVMEASKDKVIGISRTDLVARDLEILVVQ